MLGYFLCRRYPLVEAGPKADSGWKTIVMLGFFKGLKKLVQDNFLTKLTSIFVSGTIGQKVAVVLGALGVVIGLWKAFVFLLITVAGVVIIQLAIKDYETSRKDSDSE